MLYTYLVRKAQGFYTLHAHVAVSWQQLSLLVPGALPHSLLQLHGIPYLTSHAFLGVWVTAGLLLSQTVWQ